MTKPRIIRQKRPTKRMNAVVPTLTVLTTVVGFLWLGYYSQHYQPTHRLNCQDLGRCAIIDGKVHVFDPANVMTADNAAKIVYLYGEDQ